MELKSLDILLCAGNSSLSRKIRWFQRLTGAPKDEANITHVAAIYNDCVQESTILNKFCNKSGVQTNPSPEWLANYDGDVYVRQLMLPRTIDFKIKDDEFWEKHKDDDYESGIPGYLELLLCGLRIGKSLQTKELHCTELVGKRLVHHGLMDYLAVHKLPPWYWFSKIEKLINVPMTKPKKIKISC